MALLNALVLFSREEEPCLKLHSATLRGGVAVIVFRSYDKEWRYRGLISLRLEAGLSPAMVSIAPLNT